MVPFEKINAAGYNPRVATEEEIDAICRSILQFGIVDPFVLRAEDKLLIAGHQRQRAVQKLLSGRYIDPATKAPVKYTLPGGEVPAVLLSGLGDRGAKLLNLALNKTGGSWDDDKLESLFRDLTATGPGLDDLLVSGFSVKEIEALLGGNETGGQVPAPVTRVPKVVLEFSSPEKRDAVKTWLAEKGDDGELAGDTVERLLPRRRKPS